VKHSVGLQEFLCGWTWANRRGPRSSKAGNKKRWVINRNRLSPDAYTALSRCLDGQNLNASEAHCLLAEEPYLLQAMSLVADELRFRQVGDTVTYVVNRNINFTNVCIKHCGFCAFSRDFRQEEGYLLDSASVLKRVDEAVQLGATEVCVQAGLLPKMDPWLYVDLTRAIKAAHPTLHLHAFSPEEVLYGSIRAKVSTDEYLKELADAGLDSLPGTSAEILVQSLRDQISPGRITVEQWTQVIKGAHKLGLPTTSTMMYGHVETPTHWLSHFEKLLEIQSETGGFREFVPLGFVHSEAPMYLNRSEQSWAPRAGASGAETLRVHTLARILLGHQIPNLQVSWVKEGPKLSQMLLGCGVNDLGGTLINESISTSAGAAFGQCMAPADLRQMSWDLGRPVAQRNTRYDILRSFVPGEEVDDANAFSGNFGSYRELIADGKHTYRPSARPAVGVP
jgi:5-amino-6-(D-ribitylamino)uracil---L-tyrosine 4-hydroxyphenyl transferase